MKSKNGLHLISILFTFIVFGGLISAYFLSSQVQDFANEAWNVLTSEDRDLISNWISQFGIIGIILILLFFLIQMFAFILPSWFLIVVSVLAYGPVTGGIIALAGIVFSASIAYLLGHFLGDLVIKKMISPKTEQKMKLYLDKYEFWLVVIFRLSPFLSDDVISYIAGFTNMNFFRFILATIIGSSPLIAVIAYLGGTNERLINGFIVISLVCIAGFIAYVLWDRKQQRRIFTTS